MLFTTGKGAMVAAAVSEHTTVKEKKKEKTPPPSPSPPPVIKKEKKEKEKKRKKTSEPKKNGNATKKSKKGKTPFLVINSSQGYRSSASVNKLRNVTSPPTLFSVCEDDGSTPKTTKGMSINALFSSTDPKLTDVEFLKSYVGCQVYDDKIIRMIYQGKTDMKPTPIPIKYFDRSATKKAIYEIIPDCDDLLDNIIIDVVSLRDSDKKTLSPDEVLELASDNWQRFFGSEALVDKGFYYATKKEGETVILDSRLVVKLFKQRVEEKPDNSKSKTKKLSSSSSSSSSSGKKPSPASPSKNKKQSPRKEKPVASFSKEELIRTVGIGTLALKFEKKDPGHKIRNMENSFALKMLEKAGAKERYTPQAFRESKPLAIHAGFLEAPSNQKGGRKPLERAKPIETKIMDAAIQVVASSSNRCVPVCNTGHVMMVPKHGKTSKRAFSCAALSHGITKDQIRERIESFSLEKLHKRERNATMNAIKNAYKNPAPKEKKKENAHPSSKKRKKPSPEPTKPVKKQKASEIIKYNAVKSKNELDNFIKGKGKGDIKKVGSKEELDGDITLFHGDCLDILKDIPQNSIDMILCDPPYGTTRNAWDKKLDIESVWTQLRRITKKDSPMVFTTSEPYSSELVCSNLKEYKYSWIWEKNVSSGHLNVNKRPLKKHEKIDVFYRKQCVYNKQFTFSNPYKRGRFKTNTAGDCYGHQEISTAINNTDGKRFPSSILRFDRVSNKDREHPTQKPLSLLHYLIKTYTNEDDVILDFTMGSGSTGVAAKQLKRSFIGIEIEKKFYDISKKRIERATTRDSVEYVPLDSFSSPVDDSTTTAMMDPVLYESPYFVIRLEEFERIRMRCLFTEEEWNKKRKEIKDAVFGHVKTFSDTSEERGVKFRVEWFNNVVNYVNEKNIGIGNPQVRQMIRDFMFYIIFHGLEKCEDLKGFPMEERRFVDFSDFDHDENVRTWRNLGMTSIPPSRINPEKVKIKKEPLFDDSSMFEDDMGSNEEDVEDGMKLTPVVHESLVNTIWEHDSEEEKLFHSTILDLIWADKKYSAEMEAHKYKKMDEFGKKFPIDDLLKDPNFPHDLCKHKHMHKSKTMVELFIFMIDIIYSPLKIKYAGLKPVTETGRKAFGKLKK